MPSATAGHWAGWSLWFRAGADVRWERVARNWLQSDENTVAAPTWVDSCAYSLLRVALYQGKAGEDFLFEKEVAGCGCWNKHGEITANDRTKECWRAEFCCSVESVHYLLTCVPCTRRSSARDHVWNVQIACALTNVYYKFMYRFEQHWFVLSNWNKLYEAEWVKQDWLSIHSFNKSLELQE